MADVAADLKSWSSTAISNSPADTTSVGTGLGANIREVQKVIRQDMANTSVDVASASTADIGAAASDYIRITGTTTITSFGTVSGGIWKCVRFAGALTLTYNATSMILPGAVSILTAAGDVGIFKSEGSGNWRCMAWLPASRASYEAQTQTLADGATVSWDVSLGPIATVTLGGNRTMAAPTNLKAGTYILHVIQDATGSRTLTWNSVFKWQSGIAPTLSTAASAHDIIVLICDGTNLYGNAGIAFS